MKIAILGSAPSSLELAPFQDIKALSITNGPMVHPTPPFADVSWEIWGCSPGLFGQQKRIDRWFEVHRWEPGKAWFSPEYCQWLAAFKGPVYVGGNIPEIPNAVLYPVRRVEEEFSPYFLSSSISLMLALAILEIEAAWASGMPRTEGTIGLWGVDMASGEEWNEQRPGCQAFVLEALRRGIEVYLPPESDLMRPLPIYGISEWDHRYIKGVVRMRELKAKLQREVQMATAAQANARYLEGAIDDHNWQIKTWASRFGLPHGMYLRHAGGSGMGGNVEISPYDVPAPGGPVAPPAPPPRAPAGGARAYTGRVAPKIVESSTSTRGRRKRKR